MLNRNPLWKNCLIIFVAVLGFIYSSANLFKPDPAVQISGASSALVIEEAVLTNAKAALDRAGVRYFGESLSDKNALLRVESTEQQLAAKEVIQSVLGDDYVVALNLAPTTPGWLSSLGASPMKLGLDLSGGVHFLMEVDTDSVVQARLESIETQAKRFMRSARIRYQAVRVDDAGQLQIRFADEENRTNALQIFREEFSDITFTRTEAEPGQFQLTGAMPEAAVSEIENYAVQQNLVTLRNRVNELGVSEPIVQRQGRNRIVVELPGVQDTAEAKRIIGKTANLEFRLEAEANALSSARERFEFKDERMGSAYLEKTAVIGGENVTRASAGFDAQTSQPQVNISLNSDGGNKMFRASSKNIGRSLGVLFIEYKTKTVDDDGTLLEEPIQIVEEKIISLATIQTALNAEFRITGLDNAAEASELALLLRAGALAAPMHFVQESTIGPSLGEENIRVGVLSVQLGLLAVVIFMFAYYKAFGFAANVALAVNLVLLIAVMSIMGATLTLPGIAGIVLTVGMAVDANVLIFSRIKEELKNGMSPQQAIHSGFDRAFTTILDANITTLIVAIILYGIGTGPVKGFAVTLAIGILTSMFTAILGTRAIINAMYGGRSVKKLWI